MTIHDLEIAQLNKLGEISRPFSPQLKAEPTGFDRIKEAYYIYKAQEVAEEVLGVDVSMWQGDMDWAIAAASGVKFAFIRAGYGNSYVDNKLVNNRRACQDLNIPYGLYWYAVPSLSPTVHAATFANVWTEQGGGQLYPVIDLEESGGLTKTALESWVKTMIAEFQRLTGGWARIMIYSSTSFLNTYLPYSPWMVSYLLWQAAWTTNTNPPLPYGWKNRRFHQYSNKGDGKFYGAQSTYIDMNRYVGTWDAFIQEFHLNTSVASPSASPSPSPSPMIPSENVLRMRVKATSTPHVNVRTGPGTQYQDVGDLMPGYEFEAGAIAGNDAWVQLKGEPWDGYWVCVKQSGKEYCETSPD